MRPLNLNSIKPAYEGESRQLPAGAYMCAITEVTDYPAREYLEVVLDIAEGEHTAYFATDFYANKPYAHHMFFSYKETALGMLKGRLNTISEYNPGFDAVAALDAGRYELLVTRKVAVLWGAEERYNKKTDEFKVGFVQPLRLIRPDDWAKGVAAPEPKMLDRAGKLNALVKVGGFSEYEAETHLREMELAGDVAAPTPSTATSDVYAGEIPFAAPAPAPAPRWS